MFSFKTVAVLRENDGMTEFTKLWFGMLITSQLDNNDKKSGQRNDMLLGECQFGRVGKSGQYFRNPNQLQVSK